MLLIYLTEESNFGSMKYYLILRWLIYLVFSTSNSESSFYATSQMDSSNQQANFLNSSPSSHNNGDQLYSSWSEWSLCSVSCGAGISSRTRMCLKTTYNSKGVSIPLCQGDFEEHKICKLKMCAKDTPSIQETQCSQYNKRVIAGVFVRTWIPAKGGSNPCELRCEATSEQLVHSFGKVSDGTPCPQGACLDGRCLKIGCDERIGSEVLLDMCGVCGGRNSTCVHYKDVFQGQPSSSIGSRSVYHEVVSIPKEARNLIIHQTVGKNLLALQDRSKGIIFNGEQSMNKYGGHYEIAGSAVDYLKTSNLTEELFVKGPLSQELYVLVLLRANNPGIYYEYWLPKQTYGHKSGQYPVLPINYKLSFPTKTTTLPTKHKSYSVPFYAPKPTVSIQKTHHPTKPAFAYGYGEKPYKGQEPPVFRHILSTTITPPENLWRKPPIQYPTQLDQVVPSYPDSYKKDFRFRKDVIPGYKPRYIKPEVDFYQTYRNVSRLSASKSLDFPKDLPVQGDSSVSGNRHENVVPSSVRSNRNQDNVEFNPSKTEIKISKRGDDQPRKYVSNGRLKYSFESKTSGEVYANTTSGLIPEQLAINILALPDTGKPKKGAKQSGRCETCERIRNQLKNFCSSDFVIRAQVLGYEFLNGETRYELDVLQSYKNTFAMLAKEYVWAADTCRCPRLRQGKEYVIMGKSDSSYKKRESRLLVDKNSFVRTFNLKYARRLQKLRKDEAKKCKKGS